MTVNACCFAGADKAREARAAARSPARKPPADRKEKDDGKKSRADTWKQIKLSFDSFSLPVCPWGTTEQEGEK